MMFFTAQRTKRCALCGRLVIPGDEASHWKWGDPDGVAHADCAMEAPDPRPVARATPFAPGWGHPSDGARAAQQRHRREAALRRHHHQHGNREEDGLMAQHITLICDKCGSDKKVSTLTLTRAGSKSVEVELCDACWKDALADWNDRARPATKVAGRPQTRFRVTELPPQP